jgi:peptidoglycan/LPS O-acetylase OafA/YrhL
MELSAVLFSFAIIVLSAWIAFQWVIKPEREERRRQAERLHAEMRRQRDGRLAKKGKPPDGPARATPARKLSGQH